MHPLSATCSPSVARPRPRRPTGSTAPLVGLAAVAWLRWLRRRAVLLLLVSSAACEPNSRITRDRGLGGARMGAAVATNSPAPLVTGGARYLNLAWTDEGNADFAWYGASVSDAGDVNGDGYGDVLVGAPVSPAYLYDGGAALGALGHAYVYQGSAAGLGGSPVWTAEAETADGYFAFFVAAAGDVNGDGYGDVLVGEPEYGGAAGQGRVLLFHGSATGLEADPAALVESEVDGLYFGRVAGAGDVNADGYDDVIVGAPETFDDPGRAFVYFGSSSGLVTPAAWSAEAFLYGEAFGWAVDGAGDVNGDGYDDVIVGSPYANALDGGVSVYLGSASGPETAAAWSASGAFDSWFGWSVAGAGDVDGDGYDDVLVGAPQDQDEGYSFLFRGGPTGPEADAAWVVGADEEGAFLGQSVASAGDVNGDGLADVVAGASGYGDFGGALLYLGSAGGLETIPVWSGTSTQAPVADDVAFGSYGSAVSTAGDVNGDGLSDVIVGAPYHDLGEVEEGAAFVYVGGCLGDSGDSDGDHVADDCDACPGSIDATFDLDHDGACSVAGGGAVLDCDDLDPTSYPGAPSGATAQTTPAPGRSGRTRRTPTATG